MAKSSSRQPPAPAVPEPVEERTHVTTGLNLPRDLFILVNAVALKRARTRKGRASVSNVIATLIEENRADLEAEAGEQFLDLARRLREGI